MDASKGKMNSGVKKAAIILISLVALIFICSKIFTGTSESPGEKTNQINAEDQALKKNATDQCGDTTEAINLARTFIKKYCNSSQFLFEDWHKCKVEPNEKWTSDTTTVYTTDTCDFFCYLGYRVKDIENDQAYECLLWHITKENKFILCYIFPAFLNSIGNNEWFEGDGKHKFVYVSQQYLDWMKNAEREQQKRQRRLGLDK